MLPLLLCVGMFALADGAGMTSHNVVAKRTSQFEYFGPPSKTFHQESFYGLAKDRNDAIEAGAPFPDYLYLCGDDHDAGEEAHWTPFQVAAVDYIREVYPNWETEGRDGPGAGLVAFMLGVTSHYITDINWHGLEVIPAGEGIIRTMGYMDFNCTDGDLCSVAHTAADTGGEFAAAVSMNISWYPAKEWYIPVNDLVNIYARMNALGEGPLVEANWIKECGVIFYVGSWAVSTFGELVYPLMAPMLGGLLLEQYTDYPVGGVADDAAWTGFMWNRLAGWLADGTPDEMPVNKHRQTLTAADRPEAQVLRKHWLKAMRDLGADTAAMVSVVSSSGSREGLVTGGVSLGWKDGSASRNTSIRYMDVFLDEYIKPVLMQHVTELVDKEWVQQQQVQLRKRMLARLDGQDSQETAVESERMQVVAEGSEEHEGFGTSITILPHTHSQGHVLIGSPGTGSAGSPQAGVATLYFQEPGQEGLMLTGGARDKTHPHTYERFGWSSVGWDANMDGQLDIVICAPSFGGGDNVTAAKGNYSGRCDVFLAPFDPLQGQEAEQVTRYRTPDMSIYGDKDWGNFGYTVTAGDVDGDGLPDLVIAAPYAGSYPAMNENVHGDVSSQGAVYIYLAASASHTFTPQQQQVQAYEAADIVIQPAESYQWFGRSLAITAVPSSTGKTIPVLLIGAPGYHAGDSAVGRVYAYTVTGTAAACVWSITGERHAGRTGHAIAVTPASDSSVGVWMAISEPTYNTTKTHHHSRNSNHSTYTTDDTEEALGSMRDGAVLRSGRVLVLSLTAVSELAADGYHDYSITSLQSVLADTTVMELQGSVFDGRFGSTLLFARTVADKQLLVIGSPLAHLNAGAVHAWDLEAKVWAWSVRGWDVHGMRSKGRLGSALAVKGHDLYISAPTLTTVANTSTSSGMMLEETGAVYVRHLL